MRHPPGPKLTVDAVWVDRGSVLLVRRGRPPFEGRWALPGGFVEPSETVEAAVERELKEETGLTARAADLVGVFSGPDRDPRGPTATVAFWMKGRRTDPQGGDDAREASWVALRTARGLAFDHDEILAKALARFPARARAEARPRP
jgi:8-oxo-dGTP diphosphatase